MNDSFTPISPNPYIVGNPVRDRSMFFGREADFALVRKRFTDTEAKGGLLVFCGERRSGKTSILFQILDGRLGPDFLPVLIDMQSMAIESELDFLGKIAEEIAGRLEREGRPVPTSGLTTGSNPAASFHRFVGSVLRAHPDRKLILLFDEYELFENKIDAGTLTEDTLFILSSLMENHSVFLIFTGSLSLDKRKREYWKIFLGKSLFRQISYLEYEDARRLIVEPVQDRVVYDDGVVETIYRLTAGQPFYTQAVCQSLVDLLNENRTRTARIDMLEEVVAGIVRNPFPQMIFLWEGMEDREKLVMALLAETLADEEDHADPGRVVARIRAGKYPLDLDRAAVATSLEKLFSHEILLKDESRDPGYAFRMDLWRRWVKRMHSVWQVMREIGMRIRPPGRKIPLWAGVSGSAILLGLLGFLTFQLADRGSAPATGGEPAAAAAFLVLEAVPASAVIYRNDSPVGVGRFAGATPSGSHQFRISAEGYADSAFSLSLAPEDTSRMRIPLSPLLGTARIETVPEGATVTMDGRPAGSTPVELTLPVPGDHVARIHLAGYEPRTVDLPVAADSVSVTSMRLEPLTTVLAVTTTPPGARIRMDGELRGRSPLPSLPLSPGVHRFSIDLPGHVPVDTTLEVGEQGGQLHATLRTEPPGLLQLRGEAIAVMIIDNREVMRNTYNSGPITVAPGTHRILVRLATDEVVEDSVQVGSGEHVIYDYTLRRITGRTPQEGP